MVACNLSRHHQLALNVIAQIARILNHRRWGEWKDKTTTRRAWEGRGGAEGKGREMVGD